MACEHPTIELVRLPTGEVVRGICANIECWVDVPVETRADGTTWRWKGLSWVQVSDDEVVLEKIERA